MFWLTFLTALLTDQITKLMAPDYFKVAFNQGISFSWGEQLPAGLITFLLVLLALGLAYWFYKEWRQYPVIAGLFWAGVVSNLLDRIILGQVIDWIFLPGLNIKNNLADFYLSTSLISLLIKEIRIKYGRN